MRRLFSIAILGIASCTDDSPAKVPVGGRLLPGSAGGGVAFELEGPWYAQRLFERPEEVSASLTFSSLDFESDGLPPRWIAVSRPEFMLTRREAQQEWPAIIAPAWVNGRDGTVCEFRNGPGALAGCVPVAPLTPYVITLWVRTQGTPEDARHVTLVETLEEAPATLDDEFLAGLLADPSRFANMPAGISHQDVMRGKAASGNLVRKLEIQQRRPDGFEQWRIEYFTGFGARSLVVGLVGLPPSKVEGDFCVEFDDFRIAEIPLRAALGWSGMKDIVAVTGNVAAFDLDRRLAKIRRDGESRPSLLLAPECRARARFAVQQQSRLEFGLCLVPEDRLVVAGAFRQEVHWSVGSPGEPVASAGKAELILQPRTAGEGWVDVSVNLPLPADENARVWELTVEVRGQDSAQSALVALGNPTVLVPGRGVAGSSATVSSAGPRRPNVIVVSLDTLRADRLGYAPFGKSLTPNLDRLCKTGLVFEQAVAPAAYTLPSHVSMFTGQRVSHHGVLMAGQRLQPERSALLTQVLAERGYLCAAFTGGGMLNPDFCQVDTGFDLFSEIDPMLSDTDSLIQTAPRKDWPEYNSELFRSQRLEQRVFQWLADHRDVPFFLFVHTYLVHNYEPGESWYAEYQRKLRSAQPGLEASPLPLDINVARPSLPEEIDPVRDLPELQMRYDATVARADHDIGQLLQALETLGLRDNTILAIVSDHGEEFMEHGGLSHARTLYEEMVRVPWILVAPGLPPRRITRPVELSRLAPTILELLGFPVDPRMTGGDALDPEASALSYHAGVRTDGLTKQAVRDDRFKYIETRAMESALSETFSPAVIAQMQALGYQEQGGAGGVTAAAEQDELYDLAEDPGELRNLLQGGQALDPNQEKARSRMKQSLEEQESPPGGH